MLISRNNVSILNLLMDNFFPPVFQVINIIATESQVLLDLYIAINIFCAAPISICISIVYSWYIMGATALIGQLVFILIIGFQVSVLKFAILVRCISHACVYAPH